MKIIKNLSISKPVEKVWEVLGEQFAQIDKWASLISHSEVSGESKIEGVNYSIRSTKTTKGPTQQELTGFDPAKHTISYKSISGTPFFIKQVRAIWTLTSKDDTSTNLVLDFEVETQGIMGMILGPVAKIKLGKLGDEILEEFKYYVENGKAHPRKLATLNS